MSEWADDANFGVGEVKPPGMDCVKARENISAALDHALSEEDQQALGEHLHSCPDCRGALNEQVRQHRAMLENAAESRMAGCSPASDAVVAFTSDSRSSRGWLAVAAAVLLFAGGALLWAELTALPEPVQVTDVPEPGPSEVKPQPEPLVVKWRVKRDGPDQTRVVCAGVKVTAFPGCELTYQDTDLNGPGTRRLKQLSGEALYEVDLGKGPFEVDTPLGTVAVTGTLFRVSLEDR